MATQTNVPQALSTEQVKAILKEARQHSTRDWCLLLLTFRHALRSQEARTLKLADIDLEIPPSLSHGSKARAQVCRVLTVTGESRFLTRFSRCAPGSRNGWKMARGCYFHRRRAGPCLECSSFGCFASTHCQWELHRTRHTLTSCGTRFAPQWPRNMPMFTQFSNVQVTRTFPTR
jgi:integrase